MQHAQHLHGSLTPAIIKPSVSQLTEYFRIHCEKSVSGRLRDRGCCTPRACKSRNVHTLRCIRRDTNTPTPTVSSFSNFCYPHSLACQHKALAMLRRECGCSPAVVRDAWLHPSPRAHPRTAARPLRPIVPFQFFFSICPDFLGVHLFNTPAPAHSRKPTPTPTYKYTPAPLLCCVH